MIGHIRERLDLFLQGILGRQVLFFSKVANFGCGAQECQVPIK